MITLLNSLVFHGLFADVPEWSNGPGLGGEKEGFFDSQTFA